MLEIIILAQPKKVCNHYNKHSLGISCDKKCNLHLFTRNGTKISSAPPPPANYKSSPAILC